MLAFRGGYSRRVLLVFNRAIKIARDSNGRRCNVGEFNATLLCPNAPIAKVRLCLFNGWVIVMDRCREIGPDDYEAANELTGIDSVFINAECLPQNVGILRGKTVLIDYFQ